jgi:type IV secretory pathway TraG/TraD family ATPase VirD4
MYSPEVVQGSSVAPLCGYAGAARPTAGVQGVGGAAIGFDDATLGRHVLFLGGIGSGKTVGMTALVDSLRAAADPRDVFVFFDTKGDYHERFFRPGDVTLSAGGREFGGAERWNLFRELDQTPSTELLEDVTELTASLVGDLDESAGPNNRIWTAMASDLLGALVVAYQRSGKAYSNVDVRSMSDRLTLAQMRAAIEPHPDLRGTLQYIARDDSNTTTSVLIFLQQAIRRVFGGNFKRRGDFSVRSFVAGKGGRALFLEYDVARGATLAPVYRTLLDIALKQALGRQRTEGRVFFVLDEFALLPKLTHLEAGLNYGRSLGLRFIVGTQNASQILQLYGEGLGRSVLAGFGSVFAFRLFDQPSRDFVRGRFGLNRTLLRYDAAVKTRGIGEQLIDGSVIEDWDLSGLEVGQAVVGLTSGPPWLFQFAPPAPGVPR